MTDPVTPLRDMEFLPKFDAVDPYPYHGLVYYTKGDPIQSQMLDPGDGRPHVALPRTKRPSWNNGFPFHPYGPLPDGCLWDIGRPDPEVTPAILAAGGKALGKRIVERYGEGPARLGDKTYQVEVEYDLIGRAGAGEPNTLIEMYVRSRYPVIERKVFATLSHADIGVDFATLYAPDEISVANNAGKYEAVPSEISRSKDGTRRAYMVLIKRVSTFGFMSIDVTPISFFEVIISLTEDGELDARVVLLKNQAECLGTQYATADNTYVLRGSGTGGPCYPTPTLETFSESEWEPYMLGLRVGGSGSVRRVHSGVLLSAEYVGDSLSYVTGDFEFTESATLNYTPRQNFGYPNPDLITTIQCILTSYTPSREAYTQETTAKITLTQNGNSISMLYTYSVDSLVVDEGQNSVITGSTTATIGPLTRVGQPASPFIQRYFGASARGSMLASAFTFFGRTISAYPRPSTSGIAGKVSSAGIDIPVYQSALLTPAGVVGSAVVQDLGFTIDTKPAYTGAGYNPITGDGYRLIDYSDTVPDGYL